MTLHDLALAVGYLALALIALVVLAIVIGVAWGFLTGAAGHYHRVEGECPVLPHSPVNGHDATPGPMVPIGGTVAGVEPEDWE